MMAITVKVSSKGQIVIPKAVRDCLHWNMGDELVLVTTAHGAMLQSKPKQQQQPAAKPLRGFLQHQGAAVPTAMVCKPVEYDDDRF